MKPGYRLGLVIVSAILAGVGGLALAHGKKQQPFSGKISIKFTSFGHQQGWPNRRSGRPAFA